MPDMSIREIEAGLRQGRTLVQDSYASNETVSFVNFLEGCGVVETWDASLHQETRRKAKWIAAPDAQPYLAKLYLEGGLKQ